MKTVGDRLKNIRKVKGLSQQKLGESVGVGRDVIGNIEYSRVDPFDKEILLKHICNQHGINFEWLMYGTGEMEIPINEKLIKYVSEITDSDDNFIKDFIEVYWELDETSKVVLRNIASSMAKKAKEREQN